MEQGKITARQFSILVFLSMIGSSVIFIPSYLSAAVEQDAWVAIVIGIIVNQLFIGLYLLLSRLSPNRNLFEMIVFLLGKRIGSIIIFVIFIICFLVGVSSVLFDVGFFLSSQIFSNTPPIILNAMFVSIIAMALRLGLVTFARMSELLVPVFLLLFFLLIISVSPSMNVDNLKPMFQANVQELMRGVLYFVNYTTFPIIILLLIYPTHVTDQKKAAKGFLIASLSGGVVLLLMTLTCIMVLGHSITANFTVPGYVLAQHINIANFFTRIEVIMAAIWMISLYFKLLIYFYTAVQALARLTSIKSAKIYTIPLGIIAAVFATELHPDTLHFLDFNLKTWPVLSILLGVVIPILLLIVAMIRNGLKNST